MRIGIDLGGSHIAFGLVENGKILQKIEHNFLKEEKENLEVALRRIIQQEIEKLIQRTPIKEIEMIGISVPRKTNKWMFRTCSKSSNEKN